MRYAILAAASLALVTGTATAAQAGKAWSAHKVAGLVQSKHFKVNDIRRKGATYVVIARGPKGNTVEILVDGKTGKVLGLEVVKWAPGAKRVKRGSHGVGLFDEFYEFGETVPVATYTTWTEYSVTEWSSSEEYVEISSEEYSEEVVTEEVTYEESVEEVTETTAEEETVETSESSDEDSDDSSDDDDPQ